jgi:LAGLIDADG DNA endonuclease family protein
MTGDKPSGAENQQERPSSHYWLTKIPPEIGHYLAGFADGEGSFLAVFRPTKERRLPWRVGLTFNVSQIDVTVLNLFKASLESGTLRSSRADGVCYFEVNRLDQIRQRVVPFFEQFPLLSGKSRDFEIFREIAELMSQGVHLTRDGIARILILRQPMNRGGKRRYPDQVILDSLRLKESSEAIRQAPVICTG